MRAAVVDASVAAKWVAQEELTEQADALLTGVALCAPAHWQAEAVNALWGRVHRNEWDAGTAGERASALMRAPVESVALPGLIDRALRHSIDLRVTIYDSLYVALAEARRLPLVTADRKLLLKMRRSPALAALAHWLGDVPAQ